MAKDSELKEVLKLATEQAKINHKMESLKREVERQDQYIQQLQRQLKEAEQILVSEYYIVLYCDPHVNTRLKCYMLYNFIYLLCVTPTDGLLSSWQNVTCVSMHWCIFLKSWIQGYRCSTDEACGYLGWHNFNGSTFYITMELILMKFDMNYATL